jgi:hypothetical protein
MDTLPIELYREIISFVENQEIRATNKFFKDLYDSHIEQHGIVLFVKKYMLKKYCSQVNNFGLYQSLKESCRKKYLTTVDQYVLQDRKMKLFSSTRLDINNKVYLPTHVLLCELNDSIKHYRYLPYEESKSKAYYPDCDIIIFWLKTHFMGENENFIKKSAQRTFNWYCRFLSAETNGNKEILSFYSRIYFAAPVPFLW